MSHWSGHLPQPSRVGALMAARNREFLRDRSSLTWNLWG
jgi:hypothetical protein